MSKMSIKRSKLEGWLYGMANLIYKIPVLEFRYNKSESEPLKVTRLINIKTIQHNTTRHKNQLASLQKIHEVL